MTSSDCVFRAIIAGTAPATVIRRWDGVIAISPREPVTAGHTLVIPRRHVADVGVDPSISAATMAAAAELAATLPACNVITSRGAVATQTIFHLHIHVVPRHDGDELPLPWTPQHAVRAAIAAALDRARPPR
jgi:histidine triad (HIT) family protein